MVPPDEQAWLDALLAEVKPVSPEEAAELLKTWKEWAWESAHDEDTKDSFQGADDMHLRLLVSLQLAYARISEEEQRRHAMQNWALFIKG